VCTYAFFSESFEGVQGELFQKFPLHNRIPALSHPYI